MTVNGREYETLKLLGKGKGGYSYLVTDGARKLVLKQIHYEPCDYYQFGDKLASGLRDCAAGGSGNPDAPTAIMDSLFQYCLLHHISV